MYSEPKSNKKNIFSLCWGIATWTGKNLTLIFLLLAIVCECVSTLVIYDYLTSKIFIGNENAGITGIGIFLYAGVLSRLMGAVFLVGAVIIEIFFHFYRVFITKQQYSLLIRERFLTILLLSICTVAFTFLFIRDGFFIIQ